MDAREGIAVIAVWIEEVRGRWYAVAYHGTRLVATAAAEDRERAAAFVSASIPRDIERGMDEEGTDYARGVASLLARVEAGEEEPPVFELCPDCIGEPLASVARVASAIPRGFCATYGGIAVAARTEARVVGNIMATNPLYPIIPCHRVVGADLALVGYTGSQDTPALRAKLARLRAEARGFGAARTVAVASAAADLAVYPVEWAISKAAQDGVGAATQLPLL